jgi:nitrous oxide reductase accessory protein NosL
MKSTRREITKKIIFSIVMAFCMLSGSLVLAANDDAKKIPECIHCGMNRETFAHSRMMIVYNDGSKVGFCSLHCASLNIALNLDKTPSIIGVGDYNKKQLIDAEKAFWVIGGSKQGVMTQNAKWAFADRADAEKYMAENGGRIAGFDEVLQTAYEDLGRDSKMIREKRKIAKMKKMSEKIH